MGDSVGHQQEHIAALQSQTAFQYPLVTHHQFLGGIFHAFAVPQQNGLGIVKLGQVDLPVGKHLHQSEGGIGQLAHAAHRQSLGQGGDAVPDGQVVGRHGGQNLGGESGKNIGLDPAAHAVGEHKGGGVIVGDGGEKVPAQILPLLVQADKAAFHT